MKNIAETLKKNFLRISKIPRGSGHEDKIADFFVQVARKNGLEYFRDENNNVLIKKRGANGGEPVALQAHLDMVCVKDVDSKHDFGRDGIKVVFDGDRVTADGTSLGADQGVGLAMMLTLIEDNNLSYPDLEFLFTTEEETTFNGAVTFPYDKVRSKRLINLDNSKDDVVFIGADGDICNEYRFKGELVKNNLPAYKISACGFPGGNSGENVDLSKENAIVAIAKLLKDKEVFIRSINGGTNENDLATECSIVLNTNLNVHDIFQTIDAKIENTENKLCFSKEDSYKVVNEILQLRCGFITDNLASANLGLIRTINNEVKILYMLRSMDPDELKRMNAESKSLKNDFLAKEIYTDPIWEVDPESKMLKRYKQLYYKRYSTYPKEEIWHGGIECASIKKRIKGLDIISIGGTIKDYHTTGETTYVSSWVKIYELLAELLTLCSSEE